MLALLRASSAWFGSRVAEQYDMRAGERMRRTRLLLRAADAVHLPAVARSHGWSDLLPLVWDQESAVLFRTEQLGESVVELEFRQAEGGTIELTVISAEALSAGGEQQLVTRARWMLALDQDLDEFYELCRNEPRLAHVPAEGRGRILRSSSVFEDAVKCICTTNTTWGQTKGMVRRLVETLGTPSPISGRRAFPRPHTIAAAGEGLLKEKVRLGYRAPYVHQLAKRAIDGSVDLEALRFSTQSTGELRSELLQLKGIGPYAAATMLVLLGRYDYIGVDSWAKKLVSTRFHGGRPVGDREIQAAFERFGKWRALAYWFYHWDET
jgi:3-methyladenine DNA glycosylase/8-oxoguanine DNA glycosylase